MSTITPDRRDTTVPDRFALATVRRFYDLVDAGDVAGIAGLFTEDSTYYRPGYDPYVGRAGMERFYGRERQIRDGRHSLESVVATDGHVGVHGSFDGTLHDGSPVHLRFADFFVLRADGKIQRRETYFSAPLA